MLYCYYGSDTDASRKKVHATVAKMLAENPDAVYFRITDDMLEDVSFEELTGSQGLFKSEYVVVLDHLLSTAAGEARVYEALEAIAGAPHPFFVLEGALKAPAKKKLEKYATRMQEFARSTTEKESRAFNTFALTDALGAGDTKKLWTLFREAKYANVSDEEIHGILLWMYKSMALATQVQTAADAGMKPYPFQKATRYAQRFSSPTALRATAAAFALLPAESRRRSVPLEIALERHILAQ